MIFKIEKLAIKKMITSLNQVQANNLIQIKDHQAQIINFFGNQEDLGNFLLLKINLETFLINNKCMESIKWDKKLLLKELVNFLLQIISSIDNKQENQ